jgi:hypothetical protein
MVHISLSLHLWWRAFWVSQPDFLNPILALHGLIYLPSQVDIATIFLTNSGFFAGATALFPNGIGDLSASFNPGLCDGWVTFGHGDYSLRRMNP